MEILIHVCGQELYVFYNALLGMTPEYILDDPDHLIKHCPKCGAELKYEEFTTHDNSPAMNRPIYQEFSKRQRFWVSWWSTYHIDAGCSKPPFQIRESGKREGLRLDRPQLSLCAVVDAPSQVAVWNAIRMHFPDFDGRFCEEKPDGWEPGDRFPGFENRTSFLSD